MPGLISKFLLLSFFTLNVFTFANAQEVSQIAKKATHSDFFCAQAFLDPFEPASRFTQHSHEFKGKCVDTNRYRYAQKVLHTARKLVIANFHHDNQFWIAHIPLEAKAWGESFFQFVPFPEVLGVNAAHTQLKFRLNPGFSIKLFSSPGMPPIELTEFIYSVEAAMPPNFDYNIIKGTRNNYALAGRFISVKQSIDDKGMPIDNALNLTGDEISFVVRTAVDVSQSLKFNHFYNTFTNNCANQAFNVLDRLPRLVGQYPPFHIVYWFDPVMGPSRKALAERGILK
ncbi:MAG: hypothetical protein V4736_04255 [Bdellovibrionota bacterium]